MPRVALYPSEETEDAEDSEFEAWQSPFSVAALDAWLEGKMSAKLVQTLAHMVTLHPTHPGIAELAAVAGAGTDRNANRDLNRWIDRLMRNPLPAPTKVACPIIDAKTQKQFNGFLEVFEPVSPLESLSAYEGIEEIMGLDCVSDFWKAIRPDDPRLIYLQFEAGLTSEDLQKTIPLLIHGDNFEVSNDDSVMVWHFGSISTSRSSLYTGLLLGIAPSKIEVKTSKAGLGTWDSVWERWRICFEKLQQRACNLSHRFVIFVIEGDHEHFCNNLKNPHWNRKLYCWDCYASNDDPGGGRRFPNGRCGSTKRELMAEHRKRISDHAVYKIPGVSSHNNCHDALHNMWANGIGSHACGSTLHSMCYRHHVRRQPVPPRTKLTSIFTSAQILWTHNHSPTRMTNLSLSMFTDPDRPHQGHQMLKAKAAECKHFIPVLAIIARAVADGSEYDEHRARLLEGLAAFGRLMDESHIVPTDAQAEKAITIMEDVLTHADWLKQTSERDGSDRFHIVFKHHFFQHLAEQFKFMNPRFSWCFKAEDYVGRIATLVHSCSFGTRSIDLPGKALAKWRKMLHFKLSQQIHVE